MKKILMISALVIATEFVIGCSLLSVEGDVNAGNGNTVTANVDSSAILSNNNTVVNVGVPACASWNKKLGVDIVAGTKSIEWMETNTSGAPKLGILLKKELNYYDGLGLDWQHVQYVKSTIGVYTEYLIYELGIVLYRNAKGEDYVLTTRKDGTSKYWEPIRLSEAVE